MPSSHGSTAESLPERAAFPRVACKWVAVFNVFAYEIEDPVAPEPLDLTLCTLPSSPGVTALRLTL